jgi:thiol-disulfide isomerase/thioredoxin
MRAVASAALATLLLQPSDAETRIVEYLKAHVRPGEPVVVSKLLNDVFTSPEERQALDRLFNTFFKIPLFVAQHAAAAGKPPSLADIAARFGLEVPGEAEVLLTILESDPRVPRFMERDPGTGEILRVDVERIAADPRFGAALERSLAGWEGRPAPPFAVETASGGLLNSESLAGRPYLLYFWFTNCPPCLKTGPLLVALHRRYADTGLEIVGLNADAVLELPYTDDDRAAYARKLGGEMIRARLTPEVQKAYGGVSVFPSLFFVDRKGTVVRHLVNLQDEAVLEEAIRRTLG